jgi:dATP/dGTP diphosphohydrolase, N-terminal
MVGLSQQQWPSAPADAGGFMDSFDQALQVIAGIMRDGVAKHPDNEWVQRTIDYHIGRAEEHLRLLREGEQLEDHLAHAATRLLMALTAEAHASHGGG